MTSTFFSWGEIDNAIVRIIKRLSDIDFQPDVILGISRGGLIPAVKLSNVLGVPLKVAECSTYQDKKKVRRAAVQLDIAAYHLKKILVVDDIIDTGDTMEAISDALYGENYFIATLVNKIDIDSENIFSVKEEKPDTWVCFAWE